LFDRFVNIEPSAVEEVAQDPNGVSEASLSNSSIDGKLLSTDIGGSMLSVGEESTKLRITNVSESKYGLTLSHPFYFWLQFCPLNQVSVMKTTHKHAV
jgi:hypothetical protein